MALLLAALPMTPAGATWSIVAVDPKTGEVGSAGASCTPFVAGIAQLVPGHGAIVAQAASNMEAKAVGARMIGQGAGARAVIRAITDPKFDADVGSQQYGVATLVGQRPNIATFSGSGIPAVRGGRSGTTFSVQGNTLASEAAILRTANAFAAAERAGLPLKERLMRALEAGSAAGGDRRCGAKRAQSAYLGVARPGDSPDRLSVRIIVTSDRNDRRNPVQEVRARLNRGR